MTKKLGDITKKSKPNKWFWLMAFLGVVIAFGGSLHVMDIPIGEAIAKVGVIWFFLVLVMRVIQLMLEGEI
jgi:hypothetical protein